jgi:hypothetical protein
MVYIETMDAQALEDGTMSERNSRQYLAWTNSLRLTLRDLELAQRFVRLSGELDLTRDAMRRLLLNGAKGASENPSPATPGAKGPQSNPPKALGAAQVEKTILELLRSSPEWELQRSPRRRRRKGRRRASA